MNESNRRAGSFLRKWWAWVLLPIVAYLVSIPCLGPGALFVSAVIRNAPLGVLAYFEKITVNPTETQSVAIVAIHVVFWVLFVTGVALRQILPLRWLRAIWMVLVVALFMSVSGCAVQLGPGLRNKGTWH